MKPILETLRQEGTQALRRSLWLVCGGAFAVCAVLFAAAAMAAGLSNVLPLYGAILCSAALLAVIALVCFLIGARDRHSHADRPTDPPPSPTHIYDIAFQLLETQIRAQPGKTAIAAVVSGLILGALQALEHEETGKSDSK